MKRQALARLDRPIQPLRCQWIAWLMMAALLAWVACRPPASPPASEVREAPGIQIRSISPGSAGSELRPGDRLLRWEAAGSGGDEPALGGDIASVFDWRYVELESSPRGVVRIFGERGGEPLQVDLPPGDWAALEVLPVVEVGLDPAYESVLDSLRDGDIETAREIAEELLRQVESQGNGADELGFVLGEQFLQYSAWEAARDFYRASLTTDVAISRWLLEDRLGRIDRARGELSAAEKRFEEALDLATELAGEESLLAAESRRQLALLALLSKRFEEAREDLRWLEALLSAVAAGSLRLAALLNDQAVLLGQLGDLEAKETLHGDALRICEKQAPNGLEAARSFGGLANVAQRRGRFLEAERLNQRAIAIKQARAPRSFALASSWNNLAIVETKIGDFAAAERFLRRSLDLKEQIQPGGPKSASTLDNLANLAWYRDDLETAAHYDRRALAIRQRWFPGQFEETISLNSLGVNALDRGELELARSYHLQAKEIRERHAAGSEELAETLNNLAMVSMAETDWREARILFEQSLAIKQKLAPYGFGTANTLSNLGWVALEEGDLSSARRYLEASLARFVPGTTYEASVLYYLARVHRRAGREESAIDCLRRAIEALEAHATRLAGSEQAEAGYRARHREIYRDLVDLLLEQGRPMEALEVVEMSRARTLLTLLAERRMRFANEIPPDLEDRRQILARENDTLLEALLEATQNGITDEIERLRLRLSAIQQERAAIIEETRRVAPRVAEVRYPEVLGFEEIASSLPTDTVMLIYSLDDELSRVFIVHTDQDLMLRTIPAGLEDLSHQVRLLRNLVLQVRPGSRYELQLQRQSAHLYQLLIEPVAELLTDGQRLLIVPDGPLYHLPFAALGHWRPAGVQDGAEWRYLIERHPLHQIPSGTVYAQVLARRDSGGGFSSLVAFADPLAYSEAGQQMPEIAPLPDAVRAGYDLSPLPGARDEVERLGNLFERAAILLAEKATEDKAMALSAEASHLHFASHAVVDQHLPLNSFLALAPPVNGTDGNGMLEAWEVLEQLRLRADLVVLSACDTGLGRSFDGEGYLGLTWAFLVAGSRSVVSTLWKVSDLSTSHLMPRFYKHLRQGMAKDEALRAAQLELLRGPITVQAEGKELARDFSAPYYWSGFQLFGAR